MKIMKKPGNGFLAFLIGGTIGAAIGLLYAPRSGEETRQLLKDESNEMVDKAKLSIQNAQDNAMTTIQEAQTRLETLNKETKERLGKLQEIAKNTMEEQKESLGKGYSNVKEVVAE
jgi:gas vesicle protein